MMRPQLTDRAVADLPLAQGRAELLEEIMRTPVLERPTADPADPSPRRGRWLTPVAAAAVVAVLASAPAWLPADDAPAPGPRETQVAPAAPGGQAAGPTPEPTPAPVSEEPRPGPTTGHLAVLDAPGWSVEFVERQRGYGSVSYARGNDRFEITWYDAASYAGYVEDREHIVDPPAPGAPVQVLGAAGQLWAYSGNDHTVIREVQDGHWMELRGGGMDEAAYRELLGQLRLVNERGFEEAMPESSVTDDERDGVIRRWLDEIAAVAGAGLPDGAEPIRSAESDPYHLGADVAGGYACAWLDTYTRAVQAGDDAAADRAARVLATAPDWPPLHRMQGRGGYPAVLWDYAAEAAEGSVPEGYSAGLGC